METWIYLFLVAGVFVGLVLFFVKNKRGEKDQRTIDLLQAFAEEMVHENQKLLDRMVEMNRQTEKKLGIVSQQLEMLEEKIKTLQNDTEKSTVIKKSETPSSVKDTLHLYDRYKEVFHLLDQGMPIEEVSKKLGYGKGELELILQLAGRK